MNTKIQLGQTRFHSEGVAWLVKSGLSRKERICKILILLSGLVFFLALAEAKGKFFTLEALWSLLPILVGLSLRTRAKLASRGDSAQTYAGRVVQPGEEFHQLAQELAPSNLEVVSAAGNYHYVLNPRQIHWFGPWFSLNWKPLRLFWIFGLFAFLVHNQFHLPKWPGLVELQLLEYKAGRTGWLVGASVFISVLGLATVASTFKRGLKLAAQSGVIEGLFLYPSDRPGLERALENAWNDSPTSADQHL